MMKSVGNGLQICVLFVLSISCFCIQTISANVIIDGNIGDGEWKTAQEFTLSSKSPEVDVVGLVMWDEEYFYFACKIKDADVQGIHKDGIQNVWEDDDVEFYLETDNKKHNGRSTNSYQLLIGAGGAYNNTVGDGNTYDFNWDSNIEHVVKLDAGTTINNGADKDAGWHFESRLPWDDMNVEGRDVEGKTMGWNILVSIQPEGVQINSSEDVDGFTNNHDCSAWDEITFDEGHVSVDAKGKVSSLWGSVKGNK